MVLSRFLFRGRKKDAQPKLSKEKKKPLTPSEAHKERVANYKKRIREI
jgi:hypothetical protein